MIGTIKDNPNRRNGISAYVCREVRRTVQVNTSSPELTDDGFVVIECPYLGYFTQTLSMVGPTEGLGGADAWILRDQSVASGGDPTRFSCALDDPTKQIASGKANTISSATYTHDVSKTGGGRRQITLDFRHWDDSNDFTEQTLIDVDSGPGTDSFLSEPYTFDPGQLKALYYQEGWESGGVVITQYDGTINISFSAVGTWDPIAGSWDFT